MQVETGIVKKMIYPWNASKSR